MISEAYVFVKTIGELSICWTHFKLLKFSRVINIWFVANCSNFLWSFYVRDLYCLVLNIKYNFNIVNMKISQINWSKNICINKLKVAKQSFVINSRRSDSLKNDSHKANASSYKSHNQPYKKKKNQPMTTNTNINCQFHINRLCRA